MLRKRKTGLYEGVAGGGGDAAHVILVSGHLDVALVEEDEDED